MAELRLAHQYVESLSENENAQLVLANQYVESLSSNETTTERRVVVVYVEMLVPMDKPFVGWGVPV